MAYTIGQLAKLSGVTIRTLHHYDEIGLLSPGKNSKNNYRLYEEKDLLRLQQILFFRELDFALADIKKIIDRPDFAVSQALRDHKRLIKLKQKRLDNLIKTIDKTINHMTKQSIIKDEELYDVFKDNDVKQYQQEVKRRWGDTSAYQQSMAEVSKMTKGEMEKLKQDAKIFTQKLADAMDKKIESPEVQNLIKEHYQGINFFYDCSIPMYRHLAQMYVDDSRFTAYYEKFRPGLAKFVRDAICYFCDQKEKTSD
ncbi:MAG: MerR family transcriptional regulator [Candidatus Buchananbacteria bacterium]|nr:MerR family transcriptional regulator [Candidatus Buchananbacteria bacterium]